MLLYWALVVVGTLMFLAGPFLIAFRVRVAEWQTRSRANLLGDRRISPLLMVWWGFWFMVIGGFLVWVVVAHHFPN